MLLPNILTLFFINKIFYIFVEKQYKMSFEEFEEYFWSYIPENIISNVDRSMNSIDFCESVCFDCYRMYSQGVDKDTICKLAENILFNVNRFKPLLNQ